MHPRLPSLCLEYGADEENCERGLEISERGMCFQSHWQFSPGTQVGVDVCYCSEGCRTPKRARLEGIVVDCQPVENQALGKGSPRETRGASAPKCYRATVLFLELPEATRGAIKDVSSLLACVRPPLQDSPKPLPSFTLRRRGNIW